MKWMVPACQTCTRPTRDIDYGQAYILFLGFKILYSAAWTVSRNALPARAIHSPIPSLYHHHAITRDHHMHS